jgi:cytochrome oxidase assembly protein ShyY1
MKQAAVTKNRWQVDWWFASFCAVLVALTLALGYWQLARAEQKQLLLAEHQQRQMAAAVALEQLNLSDAINYRRVIIKGRFDNQKNWLLDNRVREGRVGYEVISLFETLSGQRLLLNRGWVAGDVSRRTLPVIKPVNGQQTLQAVIYSPPGKSLLLADTKNSESWPRLIQVLDVSAVAESLQQTLFPYQLRIDAYSPVAYRAEWPVVNIQPEKHSAYAVQWFAMAIAILLLFIVRSRPMMKSNDNDNNKVLNG